MTEREKIYRWDIVDNTIHNMIVELNPSTTKIKWNITPISKIRNVLVNYFVEELKLCTEDYFYP